MPSLDRVAVFIDYQNCYGAAREAFGDPSSDPALIGNLAPMALARLLAAKGSRPHKLVFVGVYAGLADATLDPKTNRARLKQISGWQRDGVTVMSRPLRYPRGWQKSKRGIEKPREKGIDVKLAIDVVMMAVRGEYDTAIIASCDTDLVPVVEALLELHDRRGTPSVEVIAWKGRGNRIGVAGRNVIERWVGPNDFTTIADHTDYNI